MYLDDTFRVKVGLAEMLKGGVIMDVTNAEQALIAEKAGAPAVMALSACSALVTSMMTPPFNISAKPTFTRNVSSKYITISLLKFQTIAGAGSRFDESRTLSSSFEKISPRILTPFSMRVGSRPAKLNRSEPG